MEKNGNIAIIGGGNIGCALARGLKGSGKFKAEQIIITRKRLEFLIDFQEEGFITLSDNAEAVNRADIIVIAVRPQQIGEVLQEISPSIKPNHLLISVVSGVSIEEIKRLLGKEIPIVRAMPNTAIAIGESMTCLACEKISESYKNKALKIFDSVGKTMFIEEEQLTPATALCACGIAFFLRVIRAASQGGIQTGFHSDEAIKMAAQTARGASTLLLNIENHPEMEIDKVTTPSGCTIAGLNEMEHNGLSSAIIKGIVTANDKAAQLYKPE